MDYYDFGSEIYSVNIHLSLYFQEYNNIPSSNYIIEMKHHCLPLISENKFIFRVNIFMLNCILS